MAELSARAQKDLDTLPERLQEKAKILIERLDREPALGKKLVAALAGKRSVWLGRTHRIIYTTDPIRVLAIPMRRDAYR
jgi:mRNA-degrading endonuclease RelE of RelBE toxin-antitoxin system